MAQFELVGWRARDGGEVRVLVKSLYHVCGIVHPTHGMKFLVQSPDEITVLESLPHCMSLCPRLSCGFALSKCILGQSSSGSPLALSGGKFFLTVGLALSYAGHGLTSFSYCLPLLEILLFVNKSFTKLQLYGLVLPLLTKGREPFSGRDGSHVAQVRAEACWALLM